MFFARTRENRHLLKPFVLKIRDGFLVGMASDPIQGAPCGQCIQLWLQDRKVWFEPSQVSELNIRKELLLNLMQNNQGHTFYEIHSDGTFNQLDCVVYPHANCQCNRANYNPTAEISKKTNFAFSPLHQIKCARYGTPDGNLWLSSATGTSHVTDKSLTIFGAGRNREASRLNAVDEWLKKVSLEELRRRNQQGEVLTSCSFQNDSVSVMKQREIQVDAIGSGANADQALLDGLSKLSLVRTLKKFSAKNPMLIVGANTWIRGRVPFFMLQQYDLHLLFYPNSTPTWVVGILALSRVRTDEPPLFAFASHANVFTALDHAIGATLIHCRPSEWSSENHVPMAEKKAHSASKLHLWWTNWVYRCPKISLRDVLQLEEYPADIELWKNYFRDGQEALSLLAMNSPLIPTGIRTLTAFQIQSEIKTTRSNVNGIGIWSNVSSLLDV